MPATVADARDLLIASVLCPDPVMFIDDRWLYDLEDDLPPVVERSLALEGPRAIEVCRSLMGATFGFKAAAGTIRGDFGISNQYNLVHGSDSPESAEKELGLFFPDGEGIVAWETADSALHASE